jgi:bifunctional DNA-binding transcriptional regulator/antitoxin component of YhaV-PrlF toxin-antitoxin module
MRITSRGQATIPQNVREQMGFLANTEVEFFVSGLKQTWEYMDRCRADEGHLVIFDRSPKKSWKKKRFVVEKSFQEHSITVWGM